MRTRTHGGFARAVLGTACGLALAAGASGLDAPELRPPPSVSDAPSAAPRTATGPGLIAVIARGADTLGSEPGSDALLADPDLAAALSTSFEGLYEEVLPGGAVMVRLQGRFRNVLFATTQESGGPRRSHQRTYPTAFELDPGGEPRVCRPIPEVSSEASHATP